MRCAYLLCILLLGCPETKTPDGDGTRPVQPTPTPVPSPPPQPLPGPSALKGGWTVHVTSKAPGVNPDMFDTPEKRAKVFFDHQAAVTGDKVVVSHKTLAKDFDAEAAAGQKLDALVTGTDWGAVATRVKAEAPSEGGTEFRFALELGGTKHEITTHHLETHAELAQIVDALKAISGVP